MAPIIRLLAFVFGIVLVLGLTVLVAVVLTWAFRYTVDLLQENDKSFRVWLSSKLPRRKRKDTDDGLD